MKILQLHLKAFGPFTDLLLDLSGGEAGMHLIYGPNEAGKSSALRAIRDLFYGIPARTDDDFVHSYAQLRLGALIEHSDGSRLEFHRRKGNQKTLRGADDESVLGDDALDRFLAGVDADMFLTMFGIDHHRLRQGGDDILQGGGRIGELLFGAGAGIAGLQEVRARLRAEMDGLFKPNASNPAINRGLRDLKEAQAAVREVQLSVDQWAAHDRDLRQAQQRKEELDSALREKQSQHNRLTRIRNALPAIAQWEAATSELKTYGDAPLLSAEFTANREQALIDLSRAAQQEKDARQALDDLDAQLSKITVPEELLGEEGAIDELRERYGAHRKALADRPAVLTSHAEAQREAEDLLRELGRAPEWEQIESLRIPEDKRIRIRELATGQEGLLERLQNARRERDRLRKTILAAEQKLDELGEPADPSSLRDAVRRIQKQGDLEAQLADAVRACERTSRDVSVRLESLPLWSGSLEEMERAKVPALETAERFEQDFRELDGEWAAVKKQRQQHEKRLRQMAAELEQFERELDVPTEEDVAASRQRRDEGWQMVLADWQEAGVEEEDVAAYLSRFPTAASLAEAYPLSVAEADQAADRIRREANRVAKKTQLQSNMEHLRGELAASATEETRHQAAHSELASAWEKQWESLGVVPLTPWEMRGWLTKREEILREAGELHAHAEQADALRTRIETAREDLLQRFVAAGGAWDSEDESLESVLQACQDRVEELQRLHDQIATLQDGLAEDRAAADEAEEHFRQAEQELTGWQKNWAAEMKRLGLEDDATAAQANSVLDTIADLFDAYGRADALQQRLDGIDRDAARFKTDTRALASRVAPEMADVEEDEIVRALSSRLNDARSIRDRHKSLHDQHDDQTDKLGAAVAAKASIEAALAAMCHQARCKAYDELPEAERRSNRRRHLEDALDKLEEQLLSQSGGAELASFVAEARTEGADPDALGPRIDLLAAEIVTLNEERDEVLRTIEREENALAQMDGSDAAAARAAECESLAARVEAELHDLAILRIASAVLGTAVERYREKNQGPIMERAGRLFADLTLHSFAGLRAEFDADGNPILVGVRSQTKEMVPVAGMSDGTRDQLYLALRIASLETWLRGHEPMPLIADDVLLNFDDQRAVAALAALAELSTFTQVIFFTHHDHLVRLAEEHLAEEVLFIHRLDGQAKNGHARRPLLGGTAYSESARAAGKA